MHEVALTREGAPRALALVEENQARKATWLKTCSEISGPIILCSCLLLFPGTPVRLLLPPHSQSPL